MNVSTFSKHLSDRTHGLHSPHVIKTVHITLNDAIDKSSAYINNDVGMNGGEEKHSYNY